MQRPRRLALGAIGVAALLITAAACSGGGHSDSEAMTVADEAGAPGPTPGPADTEVAAEGNGADGAATPGGDEATFEDYGVNPEVVTTEDNQSTFALDVDTGSYTITRNHLNQGFLPDAAAVRTEELVNYFAQDYEPPEDGIGIHIDGTTVPFLEDPSRRVVRVGLKGAVVDDADRPPATLTFVVDVSGSMADGGKLDLVREALDRLVDSLGPEDEVAIVTYSDEADLRLEATSVAEDGPIRDAVAALATEGSTNAEDGLRLGYEQAQANRREGGINRVVLLSDGVANVGEGDPGRLAEDIAQSAGNGIQLVTVGVGMGTYNDVLLEQLADQGDGFYAYVDTMREAERLFVNDLTGTLQVVAEDAKVQVTFDPAAVASYRLLGYENRQVEDDELRDDSVDGGEVGAGHTVTALYEVTLPEGAGAAADDTALATVELHWIDPDSGEPVDRSATLTAGGLVDTFDQAPERLRQDILVAAFAEALRDAPWSERVSLANVADNAEVLGGLLPDDDAVAEFVELTQTAADLAS